MNPRSLSFDYIRHQEVTDQASYLQWTTKFLQDDERMASMVHAYKTSINGIQFMFSVEIPRNVKHALELDTQQGQWQYSLAGLHCS